MKKVKFLRVPSGSKVRGIYTASSSGYVVAGDACNPNEGGGILGSIEFAGGFLYFRKVDKGGKPCRDYGRTSVKGGKMVNIEGDGVAVNANGYCIVFDDEKTTADELAVIEEDVKARRADAVIKEANAQLPVCAKCGQPSGGKPLCPKCYEASKLKGK